MTDRSKTAIESSRKEALSKRYALSLRDADSTSLLLLDKQGKVISRRNRVVRKGFLYSYFAIAPIAAGVVAGIVAGVASAIGLGIVIWKLRRAKGTEEAIRLIQANKGDEAEVLLQEIKKRRGLSRVQRGMLEHNLSVCNLMRGDGEEALAYSEKAAELVRGKRGQKRLLSNLILLHQVVVLASLERLEQAKELLDSLDRTFLFASELLTCRYWLCDLYLSFIEGKHELDDDELFKRARFALELTEPGALLVLAAWAHSYSGDEEMAKHLVAEAIDRSKTSLQKTMPRLSDWLNEQAGV